MVPVRRRLEGDSHVSELLKSFQESTIEGIPHEPFGPIALQRHFGHKRFPQSVVLPNPPKPDSFGATITARDESGQEIWMRSAEDKFTQITTPYGLYIMLTPKSDGTLDLWARFDESFLPADRVETLLEQYASMIERLATEESKDLKIADVCPHIVKSKPATNGHSTNGEFQNGDSQPDTLTGLIRNNSDKETAVIIPGEQELTLSHAQLHKLIEQLQADFAALGLKTGSTVSIALPNSLELIVAFLAATWQKGVAAPLNPTYKQDEFEFHIDDLGSNIVLIPKAAYEQEGPAVKAARAYEACVAECYWNGKKVVLDVKEKGKLAEVGQQKVLTAEKEDVALVLHTSGTTGQPKAVSDGAMIHCGHF